MITNFPVQIPKQARVYNITKNFKLWGDKWSKLMKLTTPSVGEAIEPLELSFAGGGRNNWYNGLGNLGYIC